MKKLLALLLALCIACSLIACGGEEDSERKRNDGDPAEKEQETTTAETTIPVIDIEGTTDINEAAEVTIVNAYKTDDVMPPKPSSFYTHYEAEDGEVYVVVVMDVKNTGEEEVSARDILSVTLTVDGEEYKTNTVVEEENGSSLAYGSSTKISPLTTARLYQLFSIPEDADLSTLTLTIENGDKTYTSDFTLEQFEDKIKKVTLGEEITDEDTISLTIDSVEFSTTLYPPQATGYYHYYEADDGKTYLIVKATVKNLKGSDMKYDSIAGVSCVYNEKYRYSFFQVLEADGGEDLNGYPSQYAIAPLDTGVTYYLAEVPAEVESGSVEISFYIAGEYYKLSV